jgi:filamentous hemagglutinin
VQSQCQGLSSAACTTKLQSSQATAGVVTEIFAGFTPAGFVVDIKDLLQANTMQDRSLAVLGIVLPGLGDGVKAVFKGANSGLNVGVGVVASRVNVRTGDANVTGSGLEYAWKKHGGAWGDNKSAFMISKDELKVVLQSPLVVNSPAYQSVTSGNYIRTVDMGRVVGVDAKSGGRATTFLTVITDSQGNLVNTFPGKTS